MKSIHTILLAMITIATFGKENKSLTERLQNPVYVVLTENTTPYNNLIKTIVENNWTVSNYAFVSLEEYKELKKTSENLFLMILKDESVDGSTPFEQVMQIFYITQTGGYRVNVAGTPMKNVDENMDVLEMTNAVLTIQDKLYFKLAKESESESFASFDDQVNNRTGIVKTKKLYIIQEDLADETANLDEIKSIYSGEVIIVTKEEIEKILLQKSDVAYVFVNNIKSGLTTITYKQVINASTGFVLYHSETKSLKPVAFGKSDFQKLSK